MCVALSQFAQRRGALYNAAGKEAGDACRSVALLKNLICKIKLLSLYVFVRRIYIKIYGTMNFSKPLMTA